MHVVVVGGGIAGAGAALRLRSAGCDVTLLEASPHLGGLVVSFEIGGTPLECFYHHIFPNEVHIIRLIEQLGLASKLEWLPSTMGVLTDGRIWPFTSPVDVLRFRPLTPWQRLRLGVGSLQLLATRSWTRLDDRPATDWLGKTTGRAAVDELWAPLLRAKFGPAAPTVPAAWMWGRFQQRAAARRGGGETLGYLRGGFRQMFDALTALLRTQGADVQTATRARALVVRNGRVRGIETDAGELAADAVLYTGTMPNLLPLVPVKHHDVRWSGVGLGVLCVVLETTRPITNVYWTNVCDERLPFGGIIEHTNLVPPADYTGKHVVYLSRYFTADEQVASSDSMTEAREWIDALSRGVPDFDPSCVTAVHPFRTPYAAPLVDLGYGTRLAPMQASLPGLFVCTTAQIYPHDRGMNEGLVMAERATAAILNDVSRT